MYQNVRELDFVFRPQVDFVTDSKGSDIVDFVGRFESIAADIAYVESRIRRSLNLVHENWTCPASGFKGAYTSDSMIDMVGSIYEQDILHFGYSY